MSQSKKIGLGKVRAVWVFPVDGSPCMPIRLVCASAGRKPSIGEDGMEVEARVYVFLEEFFEMIAGIKEVTVVIGIVLLTAGYKFGDAVGDVG